MNHSGSRDRAIRARGPVLPAAALLLLSMMGSAGLAGQTLDTLRLSELQERAAVHDPRVARNRLQDRASSLRTENIETANRPSVSIRGEATAASEVTEFGLSVPGSTPPAFPQDRYEVGIDIAWRVWDGGLRDARLGLEQLDGSLAYVELERALFELRQEVNAAFFQAMLTQNRLTELALLGEDLETRFSEAADRVIAGAALPADTALLRAELLVLGQGVRQGRAELDGALEVLEALTGVQIEDEVTLDLPELGSEVEAISGTPRRHPQYRVFDAKRERLAAQSRLVSLGSQPVADLFATTALGRPGLDQFREDLHGYAQGGIRLSWSPWDWGRTDRDVELIEVKRRVLETEEIFFTARLERSTRGPLNRMDALHSAILTDERVVELRALVEGQALARFNERAIPASQWVERRIDLQQARLDRLRHRAELARAQADYLTILGVEIR